MLESYFLLHDRMFNLFRRLMLGLCARCNCAGCDPAKIVVVATLLVVDANLTCYLEVNNIGSVGGK